MAGVKNTQLLGLLATTLPDLPNLSVEHTQELAHYEVMDKWFATDKKEIHDGVSIQRAITLDETGNAQHVRLHQKTPINIQDRQHQITAPWVQVQAHWSVEKREILRNRGKARFVDLISDRRLDAMMSLCTLLEKRAWTAPSSATDDLNPMGLLYWMNFLADGETATSGGFNANTIRYGDGTTSTTKGGIDASATGNSRWNGYADIYDSVSGTLAARMRSAYRQCNFRAPVTIDDMKQGFLSNFRIYAADEDIGLYEALMTTKNDDNFGPDIMKFHDITTFKRVPIIYAPVLDDYNVIGGSATSNTPAPFIGVNHNHFFPFVQQDEWLVESDPMTDKEQHNTFTTFIDGSYNFFCNNVRQAGFIIHKTITA